jgi:hypothetical protein
MATLERPHASSVPLQQELCLNLDSAVALDCSSCVEDFHNQLRENISCGEDHSAYRRDTSRALELAGKHLKKASLTKLLEVANPVCYPPTLLRTIGFVENDKEQASCLKAAMETIAFSDKPKDLFYRPEFKDLAIAHTDYQYLMDLANNFEWIPTPSVPADHQAPHQGEPSENSGAGCKEEEEMAMPASVNPSVSAAQVLEQASSAAVNELVPNAADPITGG